MFTWRILNYAIILMSHCQSKRLRAIGEFRSLGKNYRSYCSDIILHSGTYQKSASFWKIKCFCKLLHKCFSVKVVGEGHKNVLVLETDIQTMLSSLGRTDLHLET